MAQGGIDHPTYLARQVLALGPTTAGANGTLTGFALPWDVNIHQMQVLVRIAGTTSVAAINLLSGTTSIGSVTIGTNTAGAFVAGTDVKTKVTAGTPIHLKNSTDATAVVSVAVEYNIAPDTGTWLGSE